MSVEQYWMGKGLDLDRLWQDFDDGHGYINKVGVSELHLLRLTFAGHPSNLPLFDHEIIYKTVKGTFHDVKAACLTPAAYDTAAPIFLHRVERGSGIFEFLAQFYPLITWVVALGAAAMYYRKALAADQDFDERRLAVLSKFPHAKTVDMVAYMKAWTTFGRRRVLHRLIEQGLLHVEVSKVPHTSNAIGQPPDMVDMADVVPLGRETDDA